MNLEVLSAPRLSSRPMWCGETIMCREKWTTRNPNSEYGMAHIHINSRMHGAPMKKRLQRKTVLFCTGRKKAFLMLLRNTHNGAVSVITCRKRIIICWTPPSDFGMKTNHGPVSTAHCIPVNIPNLPQKDLTLLTTVTVVPGSTSIFRRN